MNKVLVISGSPKKDGNSAKLIEWFCTGIEAGGTEIEIVRAASLKTKSNGCLSCRKCQKSPDYRCLIDDEVTKTLLKMTKADLIVMVTPLYFFSPSAQLKILMDRMFSLYKWDNEAGTMETPLKGKALCLIASAFEDIGLDVVEAPFKLTADYTKMAFDSLLFPNAGVSGEIVKIKTAQEKTEAFGKKWKNKMLSEAKRKGME